MRKYVGVVLATTLMASGVSRGALDTGRTDGGVAPSGVTAVRQVVPVANFTGSWSGTSPAGTQTGRTNRNNVASICNGATLTTPLFTSTVLQSSQSAHVLTNNYNTATCYTFTLSVENPATCVHNLQPNLYLGSFNPANPLQNWIGTAGLSTGSGPSTPVTFSALVPAGSSAVYVINNTNAPPDTAAAACVYHVDITADLNLPVPSISDELRALMIVLLAIAGFLGYRRYVVRA